MTMDLSGPGGIFGRLQMPELKLTPTETKIDIVRQRIQITDINAFLELSRVLTQEKKTQMSLVNGVGTVKILGYFSFPIKFQKTCEVIGMDGPRTEFINASPDGRSVTAKIYNPSPLEMDLGDAVFECKNAEGRVLATQRGAIRIMRGESEHVVSMEINAPEDMETVGDISTLRMVGKEVTGDSWLSRGIQHYDVELPVSEELRDLILREEKRVLDARAARGTGPAANGVAVVA